MSRTIPFNIPNPIHYPFRLRRQNSYATRPPGLRSIRMLIPNIHLNPQEHRQKASLRRLVNFQSHTPDLRIPKSRLDSKNKAWLPIRA